MENTNLTLMEPFDPISRPEKNVASQQKSNASHITQDEVAVAILSSKNTTNRTEKHFSLPTNMTTLYRTEKSASLHSERTPYRTESCASLPSEIIMYTTEKPASLPSERTTYRTEKSAFLPSESTTYKTEKHACLSSEMITYRTKKPASLPSEMTTYKIEKHACLPSEMITNRKEKYASLKPTGVDTNTCVKSFGVGMYTCLKSGNIGTYTSLKSGSEFTNTCLKSGSEVTNTCLKSRSEVTNTCLKSGGEVTNTCLKSRSEVTNTCLKSGSEVTNTCLKSGGEVTNTCLKSGGEVTNTCLKSGSEVTNTCLKSRSEVTNTCLKSGSEVTNTCLKSGSEVTNTCLKSGSEVTNTCLKSGSEVTNTCLKSGSEVTNTCLKSGSEVTNTCLKKSEGAVTYSCLKKSGDLANTKACLKKSEVTETHTCPKSDSTPMIVLTNRENTILGTSAIISEKHSTAKPVKHNSSKQTESQVFSEVITQEMCSQTSPVKNYTISHTVCIPKASELLSTTRLCNDTDQVGPCVLEENLSDTSIALNKHVIIHSSYLQEPQQVYIDPVIQKPIHGKVGLKNVVGFNKENQLTCFSKTSMNRDEINTQTSCKITVSSPGRGKNKESWQPQLRMLDVPSTMCSGKRINDCSHSHKQRHLSGLVQVAEHSHNKEQTGQISQNTSCVFYTLLNIDKTSKRSLMSNLNCASKCATTAKENKKPFNAQGNCHEVTIVSKFKSENEDTPKSEFVRQPQNLMKSLKLPHLRTRKRQSKTKHKRLSRKAKSDNQCVKDVHHAINNLLSEVNVKKGQPQRNNLGHIDSPKECTNTSFINKYPTGSQNWMSGTLETESTQQTDNASCRDLCRILGSVTSFLKQPSARTTSDMIYENSRSQSDAVDYREVSSLNSSFELKHPLRLTRKRKVHEIDYFNETNESFHNKRSRKQRSSTGFSGAKKDGQAKKLEEEKQKASIQAKSQKVQEELFHTQKNSRTLQINSTANHKVKTTTHIQADMRNVSNILNTSGISNSRMAKKSATIENDNPVFKRNITKSCFSDRSINNLQTAQERTVGEQPSDVSRLLRAKAVKRALSFNTKRSPQMTNNEPFTVTNKKAGGTLSVQTPFCKTENGGTSDGKENDCFKLLDAQSSGSSKSINSKCLDLSTPVHDLNLSDPYEFKVSPSKPQEKINVSQRQTKTACQRRSKLRSQTSKKRNKRLVAGAKSAICCASSVSISDLVEQKSKYLFPGNSEVIPLATMIHNHQKKGEENEKCLQTRKVNTNQCTMAKKTEFPSTERDTMSKNTYMKTSSVNYFSCSSKDTTLMKVPMSKNNIAMIVDNKGFQSVASEETNAALGSLYFEQQLIGNKQSVENSKTDNLPVSCSSFPHTMVDDHKPTNVDLGSLYIEKQLSGNKQSVVNSRIDKLPVSCSLFPYTRVDDYKPTNAALGSLYFEQQLIGNKHSVENSKTDTLPVSCSLFPHTRVDDNKPSGHDVSTVDFKQNLTLASGNCNDEESFSDEEVLLLD